MPVAPMARRMTVSALPLYHRAIDWAAFEAAYPPPDIFAETVYQWPIDRVRALQNERFLDAVAVGWENPFFRRRWRAAGLEPGDIRSLDDIAKLPVYTTDDLKTDQQDHPPFGSGTGIADPRSFMATAPLKLQTSGGTTGKPRMTLHGPLEWEVAALGTARGQYLQGARPGDVMQIPATCSMAMLGWAFYAACHHYLGVLPITSGSGVVTPSRRQIELAFDCGANIWMSFPEYLIRLAKAAQEEFGRDIRELGTKYITTFLGPDTEGTLRAELERLWGCPVFDNYGTNEIGLGAGECQARDGLHFCEDLLYFEVLDIETGAPLPAGAIGNLVVTAFYRTVQPVIRFNLRDLGRIVATAPCGCGSAFRRMDHFLGRSDSMIRMRGVNVYPMACLPAIRSDARTTGEWVCEAWLDTAGAAPREALAIHVEVRKDAGALDGLTDHLEARLKSDLGLSVEVRLVAEGSLATSGTLGEGKVSRLIERRPAYRKES
jgi:phenylacetate-CoA ligase